MGQGRETFVLTRAARLVLGATFAVGLGAAVCAAPASPAMNVHPVAKAAPAPVVTETAFQAFGEGPALSVRKSFGHHDEDCVTVTQIKGADGRIYTSRGMVCAQ